MAIADIQKTSGCNRSLATGNIGRLKRRKPYPPIFSSTAASTTDPAVGAWTCASGSQVWTGHIGILTAKEAKNARNNSVCTPPTTVMPSTCMVSDEKSKASSSAMSVVPAMRAIAIIATSISTDPRNV